PPGPDAAPPGPDAAPPYRHTLSIDGVDDFDAAAEALPTTTATYGAYVAWDDASIYIGYRGDDIASGDRNRWLLVFFDTAPGGATEGETYNTQRPGLPAGFAADYVWRWRASNDFQQLQRFDGTAWVDTGVVPATFQAGTFVETAIPRSAVGAIGSANITALMINETPLAEWAYAGLYDGNFTDGYYDAAVSPIPMTSFLSADFASPAPPNDPSRRRP
ncbi:MAG: hypothetical protein D6689_05975, partial [Deltaproteobacteria bacterium]